MNRVAVAPTSGLTGEREGLVEQPLAERAVDDVVERERLGRSRQQQVATQLDEGGDSRAGRDVGERPADDALHSVHIGQVGQLVASRVVEQLRDHPGDGDIELVAGQAGQVEGDLGFEQSVGERRGILGGHVTTVRHQRVPARPST
jgi:hypothetical protein